MGSLKIGVVGDIHTFWNQRDVEYFNGSDYDLLLFVGDLPDRKLWQVNKEARRLAAIRKPAYLIPGNHDALTLLQLVGEFFMNPLLIKLGAPGHQRRVERLRQALQPITMCGYSAHSLPFADEPIALICGRPHSMGGGLNVAPYLTQAFRVRTLDESAVRINQLVDQTPEQRCIFMAHHGPAGLGAEPTDPWGCDFKKNGGDWGDPDLQLAIRYAKSRGKQVSAVIAGHMHYPTKTNRRMRRWCALHDGTWYINAARVPRILRRGAGQFAQHHIALELTAEKTRVFEVWVLPGGEERTEIEPGDVAS